MKHLGPESLAPVLSDCYSPAVDPNARKGPRHMGLIVDDAVVDGVDDAGTLGSRLPEGDDVAQAPEVDVARAAEGPAAFEPLAPPPAPPPDQSDLLDESEPMATTAAQFLYTTSRPPPPPASGPLESEPAPARPSAPPSSSAPERRSSRWDADAPSSPEMNTRASTFARTGHPVRDRLLARAAAATPPARTSSDGSRTSSTPSKYSAQANATPAQLGSTFEKGQPLPEFSALDAFGDELDEIAAPKPSGAPIRIAGTTLSSSSLLVFGTVLGLAAVASLFALLIEFAPQAADPEQPVSTSLAASPVSTAPLEPAPNLVPPPERKRVNGPWRIPAAAPGQKRIEGDIGRDPFLKAIQAAGISTNEAYRVYTALKEEKNLDRCRPKDHFIALLDRSSNRVLAFEYIVSKEEIYQAREGKDGLLKGAKLDLEIKKQRVQGSMILSGGTFEDAARAAHLEPSLGAVVNKALDGHTSILQFQRGDRLRVVAQEVTVLGEFARYAGIEALEYVPAHGKPLRIYYYPARKKYYDSQGRAPGEGGWRRPVKGAPITSKYNPNRLHPILKKRMPHTGTDFGAPTGTPIHASSYGVITKLGAYGPNGNFIAIQHDHGYETGYSHLSRFEPGLKVGDKVSRMQVIGYVGSTGRSTGPHLHFSAKKNGAFIDPESLNMDALSVLPPEDRAGFAQVKAQYEALLEAVPLAPPLNEPPPPAPSAAPDLDLEGGEGEDPHAAAAAPPVVFAGDHAEELDDMDAVAAPAQQAAQAQVAVPPPGAPVPAQRPTLPTAPPRNAAAFYLSDKELMESQAASDEGEVER